MGKMPGGTNISIYWINCEKKMKKDDGEKSLTIQAIAVVISCRVG
jgi:hypothetical protein